MKQYDILLSIKGELEWICGIYEDEINAAIQAAIELVGAAEYVGHKAYTIMDGAWVEVKA